MLKEIDEFAELEEQTAKDEQHTFEEIRAIIAKENHVPLDIKDPLMVLVTLTRILQKESRRDNRRLLNDYDSLLRETLTEIAKSAQEREKNLMEQALKHLDEIGNNELQQLMKQLNLRLTSSLNDFLLKKMFPKIDKKVLKIYYLCGACLGLSFMLFLFCLALFFKG